MAKHSGDRSPHPWIYLPLYAPFGAATGYITVTLGYVLRGAGVSVADIAWLAGLTLLPNTWKVLWAPLVDTTLSARTWFVIGAVLTAGVFVALGLTPLGPKSVGLLGVLSFLVGGASTFTAMAAERLMAFSTPPEEQGRAGGWSQAGNLGGAGLGGGVALWLCQHSSPLMGGLSMALLCALACLALLGFRESAAPEAGKPYSRILKDAGRDVLGLAASRIGLLACFICLLPLGTGAVSNVWGAVARDWNASADDAALVAGLLSGVVSIIGSLIGGYVCDRMDRKGGYVLFGLLSAASAVMLALGPRTPMAFLVLATLYNLIIGGCYAAYAALTLEAIGHGAAAATKFNLVASISNVPILLMTLVDGQAETRWGASGMLYIEAGFGVAAAGLFYLVAWSSRGWSWAGLRRKIGLAAA